MRRERRQPFYVCKFPGNSWKGFSESAILLFRFVKVFFPLQTKKNKIKKNKENQEEINKTLENRNKFPL